MSSLRVGTYRFYCRMLNEAILPPFKGSTFRGMFGYALRQVVCALKSLNCDNCLLADRCLYARIFENPRLEMPKGLREMSFPRPVIFEPPTDEKEFYNKDDVFCFTVRLFGNFNDSLAYFIYAVSEFGIAGIGKKNMDGQRGQFVLERVEEDGVEIYNNVDSTLIATNKGQILTCSNINLADSATPQSGASKLTVTLHTPLRVKREKKFQADLPFHVLIRSTLRRISSLFICFGQGAEPALEYKELVRLAEQVETTFSDLHWFDLARYSNRQDQKMLIGGMLGSITYAGNILPFIPLLELAEILHLGKQTTFGLGHISINY